MVEIDQLTTWRDLKTDYTSRETYSLKENSRVSFTDYISEVMTGATPVTNKMYSLVKAKIKDHLVEKCHVKNVDQDPVILEEVTRQFLSQCRVNYRDLNYTDAIQKLFHKIDQSQIECYENPIAEPKKQPEENVKRQIAYLVNFLLGVPLEWKMISWELVKAILFQEDQKFKDAFKEVLLETADDILKKIQENPQSERIYEITLGNILALLPFAEPSKELTVPQKIKGKWQPVTYKVDLISLNPPWLGGSMPAFGLTPVSEEQGAERLLLYRGTCQPTGSGFLCTLFADLLPSYSVGEFIYNNFAKGAVGEWLGKAEGKVKIYGQSLGGALAWLTQLDHPQRVSEINIYGAPMPLAAEKPSSGVESVTDKPTVNVYCNDGDYVPQVGNGAHSHWNVFKLFVQQVRKYVFAHGSVYAAFPKVVVMKLDVEADGQTTTRKIMNLIHKIFSVLVLPTIITLIAVTALKYLIVGVASALHARFSKSGNPLSLSV